MTCLRTCDGRIIYQYDLIWTGLDLERLIQV